MVEPLGETIWRFVEHRSLQKAEEALRTSGISYNRHSTTVSYFLQTEGQASLQSYEIHVSYTGVELPSGDPEVEKSYVRNSYGILRTPEGSHWIAESTGQIISENEFYGMVLYAHPNRVLSLQQISFEFRGTQYLVELNMESKLLVLIGLGNGSPCEAPPVIADMIDPEGLSRSGYLLELFESNGGPLSS